MLQQESFDRQGLQKALITWSGDVPYVTSLLEKWEQLWQKLNQPPVISSPRLSKTTFSSKGGKVTISATITDDKGVISAWVLINGASPPVPLQGKDSVYTAKWTAPKNNGTTAQTYTITLFARDTAGNQTGPVEAGKVTVQGKKGKRQGIIAEDDDAPKISATAPLTLRLLSSISGKGGTPRMFMFILNKPARVEARLLSPTGKLLRRFEPRQAQVGLNSFLWEGKTQSGAAASRGVYLLQLSATDEKGNVAQAAMTVMVR